MAPEARRQIAIGAIEGYKLLQALGMADELARRVERFELICESASDPIRLNVTFFVMDPDIPAIGAAVAGYQLVRSED